MKKNIYTPIAKVLGMILIDACTITLVTSLILVLTLIDKSILNVEDLGNKSFEQSAYLEEISAEQTTDIVQYMKYCDQFETDGVFDEDKRVDVSEYAKNSVITGTPGEDGIGDTYKLKDLVKWSQEGYETRTPYLYTRLWVADNGTVYQTQSCQSASGQIYTVEKEILSEADLEENTKYHLLNVLGNNYDLYSLDSEEISLTDAYLYLKSQENSGATDELEDTGEDTTTVTEEDETTYIIDEIDDGVYDADELYDIIALQNGVAGEEAEVVPYILEKCETTEVETETSVTLIDETYLSEEGSSILELWAAGAITDVQITELSENLIQTISKISTNVTTYKQMRNRLDQSDSNVYYWFQASADSAVRTNIEKGSTLNATELKEQAKKYGKYLLYNEKDMTLNTNMADMENYVYSDLENDYEHDGNTMILLVGIDLETPYADVISDARDEYNHYHPFVMVGLLLAILSAIGWIICILYLSSAAGHVEGKEGITTNAFDRIYGEIIVVGGIFAAVMLFFTLIDTYSISNAMTINLLMAGALTLVGISIFQLIYLSLVRRVKAGTFWTQTIIYKTCESLGKLYRTRKITTAIVMKYLLHLLICLILASLAFAGDNAIAALLLLALCIYEGKVLVKDTIQRKKLADGIAQIADGDVEYKIQIHELSGKNQEMGVAINNIGEGLYKAVDANMKNERLKTDLITNVSHDIKTPLTSIINYVDLIDREEIQNEKVQEYINILKSKSQRLKQLTEDLVEASKVSSGNVKMNIERINFVELAYQTAAEFAEKFEKNFLKEVDNFTSEPIVILADGRSLYRVIENLYNNAAKYAQEHTRVYVELEKQGDQAVFSIKNVSKQELNIKAEELTERFIRGDISRSTEGSGLGLSIAKNLTELMHGDFEIYLDGDLFKVTVALPLAPDREEEKQEES